MNYLDRIIKGAEKFIILTLIALMAIVLYFIWDKFPHFDSQKIGI